VTNNLILTFSPEEDPFEEDKDQGLVWGRIDLNVVNRNGEVVQRVIGMVWDVRQLIEWLLTNESYLYNEQFPKEYIVGGNSLAEYRWRYYDLRADDSIDDVADEILYNYNTRHVVYHGMSGTKTIHAYIGNRNDGHEISYYRSEAENWRYEIDLAQFMIGVRKIRDAYF
jgi:hypothetical protein